jgi:hypothetical protein
VRRRAEAAAHRRLRDEAVPAAPFQQAISRRHDVELRPARRLGITREIPLRSECLEFRSDAEQRRDGAEGILNTRGGGACSR